MTSPEPDNHPVDRLVMFRDATGEWRWRAVARNQRVVAASGESYHNHADCESIARRLFPAIPVDEESKKPPAMADTPEPATLSPADLRDGGYLQEVNRQFFHPLGLALAVWPDDEPAADGTFRAQIWDYRLDPEGFLFVDLTDPVAAAHANRVSDEHAAKHQTRRAVIGELDTRCVAAAIQPIGSHLQEDLPDA